MTDKVQKIREEVERLQNELIQEKEKGYGSDIDDACILELQNILTYIDSLQEEPVIVDAPPYDYVKGFSDGRLYEKRQKEESVSEFLNTESMIESYKQRLISQANGMKNSSLIDMCLASYKHGINETLDTLNLSNV